MTAGSTRSTKRLSRRTAWLEALTPAAGDAPGGVDAHGDVEDATSKRRRPDAD
jgi:hypothetical protein